MPVKKKKGKKSGKKKGTKTPAKLSDKDPIPHTVYVPPPPLHGERLLKLLKTHKVEEKELHGFKVSTRILENLTPQEIRDLRVVFEVFDIQGVGYIGPSELRKAFRGLGFKISREQSRRMIHEASTQGKGAINFNEFLELVLERQGESRDIYEEIMQGFTMFDYDKEGKFSMENLKAACLEAGVKFTKEDLKGMMEEADTNGDGFVDKDEFIKIMLQTNLF